MLWSMASPDYLHGLAAYYRPKSISKLYWSEFGMVESLPWFAHEADRTLPLSWERANAYNKWNKAWKEILLKWHLHHRCQCHDRPQSAINLFTITWICFDWTVHPGGWTHWRTRPDESWSRAILSCNVLLLAVLNGLWRCLKCLLTDSLEIRILCYASKCTLITCSCLGHVLQFADVHIFYQSCTMNKKWSARICQSTYNAKIVPAAEQFSNFKTFIRQSLFSLCSIIAEMFQPWYGFRLFRQVTLCKFHL